MWDARALAVAALTGVLGLTGLIAAVGFSSPIVDRPATFVTLRAVFCVGLAAIAVVALRRGFNRRLAAILLATAYAFVIAGLTEVDSPVPFTVGRIAVPVSLLLVMYFCLAYPSGRLEGRGTAVTFAVAATVIVVLDLASVLLSRFQPVAGPFVRCAGTACPHNPFAVIGLGSGPAHDLSVLLGLGTSAAVFAAGVLTGRRAIRATRLQRRSLTAVFAWTILAALSYGSFVALRAVDQHSRPLSAGAVVVAAVIAAMPLAIAVGFVRGRLFATHALEAMVAGLSEHPSLFALQRTMSRAFADPTLQLLVWRPERRLYVDPDGNPVDAAALSPARTVTEFARGEERVAAAVHDPALDGDRPLLEAAGRALRLVLEKAELETRLSSSIVELEASRKRVASAADAERRRIEQDLHDGAQQELIGLRIKLELLRENAGQDARAVLRGLDDVGRRVDLAIENIRNLANGVYPGVLRDLGLTYALAALARDVPLAVAFHSQVRGRFSPEVETAVYFCCAEAVQNVAKHCGAGTAVTVRLSEDASGLRFTVVDQGPGLPAGRAPGGHGITGMHDRLEALGGTLRVTSPRGAGTTVTGRVPAAPA